MELVVTNGDDISVTFENGVAVIIKRIDSTTYSVDKVDEKVDILGFSHFQPCMEFPYKILKTFSSYANFYNTNMTITLRDYLEKQENKTVRLESPDKIYRMLSNNSYRDTNLSQTVNILNNRYGNSNKFKSYDYDTQNYKLSDLKNLM